METNRIVNWGNRRPAFEDFQTFLQTHPLLTNWKVEWDASDFVWNLLPLTDDLRAEHDGSHLLVRWNNDHVEFVIRNNHSDQTRQIADTLKRDCRIRWNIRVVRSCCPFSPSS